MADLKIVATGGRAGREVPEETATELQEAFEALAGLPRAHNIIADFDSVEEAKEYVKVANAWATQNGVKFARKGDIKGEPTRVAFRLYAPKSA